MRFIRFGGVSNSFYKIENTAIGLAVLLLKLIKMIYFSIPPTILPTKLSEPEFAVVCSGPFDDVLTVPFMVGATRTLPVPR